MRSSVAYAKANIKKTSVFITSMYWFTVRIKNISANCILRILNKTKIKEKITGIITNNTMSVPQCCNDFKLEKQHLKNRLLI